MDELRKFHHFFRHASALDLRADKLERVLTLFIRGHTAVDADLQAFVSFIDATVTQLEGAT